MARTCARGHEVAGSNLYVTAGGREVCRACQRKFKLDFKSRHGLPIRGRPGRPPITVDQVFARLAPDSSGCLVWPLCCDVNGYGRTTIDKKQSYVHRVIYEAVIGTVPQGLVLHHQCKNRRCANPAHLEVCRVMENTLKDHPDLFTRRKKLR